VAQLICGVDISSTTLEASIGTEGATGSFSNDPAGIDALAAFCRLHRVTLIAMEATGGYERKSFTRLSQHGLGVAILNPRSVRQFASSVGRLEKTDRIDADMIAWFAEVKKSRPTVLAPDSQLHVRALVTRLRQLTAIQTSQKNQQRLVTDPMVLATFNRSSACSNSRSRILQDRSPHSSIKTLYGKSWTRASGPSAASRIAQ
jgi:transposase